MDPGRAQRGTSRRQGRILTDIRNAGETREVLFAPIPTLAVGGGMAREVLLATATAISFGGVAREILLFGLETTTIGAARYSDPDSIYQATIKLRTNLVASRYIDPDSVYQAIIKLRTNLVASCYIDLDSFYQATI
jgi:hypothetical protein